MKPLEFEDLRDGDGRVCFADVSEGDSRDGETIGRIIDFFAAGGGISGMDAIRYSAPLCVLIDRAREVVGEDLQKTVQRVQKTVEHFFPEGGLSAREKNLQELYGILNGRERVISWEYEERIFEEYFPLTADEQKRILAIVSRDPHILGVIDPEFGLPIIERISREARYWEISHEKVYGEFIKDLLVASKTPKEEWIKKAQKFGWERLLKILPPSVVEECVEYPLHSAIKLKRIDLVRYLLLHKKQYLNQRDEEGFTPLVMLTNYGPFLGPILFTEMLNELLYYSAKVDEEDFQMMFGLLCFWGRVDTVSEFLRLTKKHGYEDPSYEEGFAIAAKEDHQDLCEWLVKRRGVDPLCSQMCLFCVAMEQNSQLVEFFLRREGVVERLKAIGDEKEIKENVFSYALKNKYPEVWRTVYENERFQSWIQQKKSEEKFWIFDHVFLQAAVMNKMKQQRACHPMDLKMIRDLLSDDDFQRYLTKELSLKTQREFFYAACMVDEVLLVKLFLERGKIDFLERISKTEAMHHACEYGAFEAVKILYHANPQCLSGVNYRGETALDLARRRGYQKIVTFLERENERVRMQKRG